GTLGRPSGNRSPCQSGVYLITSSEVKKPCCGCAVATVTAIRARHRIPQGIRLRPLFILAFPPLILVRLCWIQTKSFPGLVLFAPPLRSCQYQGPTYRSR